MVIKMIESKNLIPKIRFKGFTNVWEQRKVANTFKVTRGYVLAATETDSTKSNKKPYPVYSSQTRDNGLMGYYSDYLYENAITWTTDGANAGTVKYRTGKFYCTNVCGVLLTNEIKPNQMIAEALNNIAKHYVSYVGNPKLMNNVMSEIEIMLPIEETERNQISQLFLNIDNLITLHQRKYDKLIDIKKSLLEKMFPKNSSNIPDIRFKGFTKVWEQRKLNELGNIQTGNTPSTSNKEYYSDNGMRWITPTDITSNVISKTERKLSESGQKVARIVPENSILVTCIASIGKNTLTTEKSAFNQQINSLTADIKEHDPYYLLTDSNNW